MQAIKYTKEKNSILALNKKNNKNTNNNTKHESAVIALSGKIINMDKNKITASIKKFFWVKLL